MVLKEGVWRGRRRVGEGSAREACKGSLPVLLYRLKTNFIGLGDSVIACSLLRSVITIINCVKYPYSLLVPADLTYSNTKTTVIRRAVCIRDVR